MTDSLAKKRFITLLDLFEVMNEKRLLKIVATIGFWRNVALWA